MFDLGPAAAELTRLLAHVHQFAAVFTGNATRTPPAPPGSLVEDWRAAIPRQLEELAAAWRDESAWEGRVSAGGGATRLEQTLARTGRDPRWTAG